MKRSGLRVWLTAGVAVAASALSPASQSGHSDAGSGYSGGGPSSYASLVGTDREDAQKKLGKMGFRMQKPANDDRGSLWWNGATKECVELRGKKGRVKSIEPTSASRCH